MITPPFGMEEELTQIRTQEYITRTATYPRPDGKPGCYEHSNKPCQGCPWRNSCKNAEGRI